MLSMFSTSTSRCCLLAARCLHSAAASLRHLLVIAVGIAIAVTMPAIGSAQALPLSQIAAPREPVMPPPTEAISPASALSASTLPAPILFEQNCAGCHVNGGNIIRRGKNLKKRAMQRNGYDTVAAIAQIITHGKGIMSGYSDRLNEEEIGAIAQYVHQKSETGW